MQDLKLEILKIIEKQRVEDHTISDKRREEDRLLGDQRHQDNVDAFKAINLTLKGLEPLAKVYSSFDGFGTVTSFVFKFLVVPLSVIIGIILTIKNISK